MIYNNVILRVKSTHDIERISELLATQAKISLKEQGCERFEVYQSETDKQTFLLIEWWQTQDDLDQHKLAKQFVEVYMHQVVPLVDRIPHQSKRIA
jgi:quinol monooxygenase YgiN